MSSWDKAFVTLTAFAMVVAVVTGLVIQLWNEGSYFGMVGVLCCAVWILCATAGIVSDEE